MTPPVEIGGVTASGRGTNRYYGKYRGTIKNNVDPLMLGRVQVEVPAVLGEGRLAWAMPCVPYAGDNVGLFAVPPLGAHAWVEFEGGDPDHPILAGCFWATGEVPAVPAIPTTKMLKTEGVRMEFNDLPGAGGFTLEVGPPVVPLPMTIQCSANGIEITHGAASVKLTPASVSVNSGALEVI